jgi:hypothetical protein
MRFHYKLRNSQIREHPECMMTSCAIFVVVAESSFALGDVAPILDLVSIARRQMRFHYKLRNSQIREHPECMMTSCTIFVVVAESSFALGDVAPILDLVRIV